MPAGRPPKPTEQKRKLGNPGKRALPEPAAMLPAAGQIVPEPPRGLRRHGKETWVRLWSAGHSWLSPDTDRDVLIRLCELHDERAALRKVIRIQHMGEDLAQLGMIGPTKKPFNHGYFGLGSTGQIVLHPAVKSLRMVEAEIVKLESLCGFTPSDRSRMGVALVKGMSKLEELLAKRQARMSAAAAAN